MGIAFVIGGLVANQYFMQTDNADKLRNL